MATTVRFEQGCLFNFGERTPDRRALAKQSIRAIFELLGRTGGLPPGVRAIGALQPPRYAWEDANWLVGYTREETGQGILVSIYMIQLKLDFASS